MPRSENPTDGLILRTASRPEACDDRVLANLAPIARYIVDAELARTPVTDAGLEQLAAFENLRTLDLSHTAVSSEGIKALGKLPRLQIINLTGTPVDDSAASALRASKTLKQLFVFHTKVTS